MQRNLLKNQKGSITLLVIMLVILLGIVITGGFEVRSPSNVKPTPTPFIVGIPLPPPAQDKKNSLQLGTVPFGTVTPAASVPQATQPPVVNQCEKEGLVINNCTCPPPNEICPGPNCEFIQLCQASCTPAKYYNGQPYCLNPAGTEYFNCDAIARDLSDGQIHCIGKPVIYLYPTKNTLVDVKLTIPGIIYKSIPHYPENGPASPQGGWQNVLAHPDGQLEYNKQTYHELYYESQVKNIAHPQTGIVIAKTELSKQLLILTGKLGLLPIEQREFLDYWMPKLQNLKANHILFSVIDTTEKERIDHVDITPKPDTFIAFLAYFKPLEYPIAVEPLKLPDTPPQRIGFTAVEWGGTIDN